MNLALLLIGAALAKVPTKMPPEREKGRQLYEVNCWMCHGEAGLGDGPAARSTKTPAPALAGRVEPARMDDLVEVIQEGRGDMPGFSAVMDRHDAERILKWLSSLDPDTGRDLLRKDDEAEDDDDEGQDEAGGGG